MNNVHFDSSANSFIINQSDEFHSILNVKQDYPPDRFSVYYLNNEREDYGENSIYQVFIYPSDTRIGWIFPGQALFSDQHDYAQDPFFLKYAYVVLYKILQVYDDIDPNIICDKVLLVIDLENTSRIPGFVLEDYIISLYSYGYTFTGKGNMFSSINKVAGKHMHLKPISNVLNDKKRYIQNLYKDHIPNSRDAISTFLLFYQIIEILIAIIFNDLFLEIINEISNTPNVDLMEKKDRISESASEKQRVKQLFGHRSSIESDHLSALNDACEYLLREYNQEIKDTPAEKLYSVRCMLIHRCYILDNKGMELIQDINDALSIVTVDMLIGFK